jgi:hypothetical protein
MDQVGIGKARVGWIGQVKQAAVSASTKLWRLLTGAKAGPITVSQEKVQQTVAQAAAVLARGDRNRPDTQAAPSPAVSAAQPGATGTVVPTAQPVAAPGPQRAAVGAEISAVVVGSVSDREKKVADLAKFVFQTLRSNTRSGITEKMAADRWGQKSDAALEFWGSREARRYFQNCVSYLNGDPTGNWPDRSFHQVADIALWTEVLTKNGTVREPKGEWMQAIEMALPGIELGPNSDIGHPEEHWRAARNAASTAGYAGFSPALALKVQALISCSSAKGLYVETILTDPAAAREKIKKHLYDAEPAFFDTQEGRQAFADALLITKMSDMSRGSHGTTVAAIERDYLANDRMIREYRKAHGLT